MRKKLSRWAHCELKVTTVVTAHGPMITAQSRLGEVTARSRQGHSSVTARSQLSHGSVTAQSWHLQYDHGSVTARSQLNHGPGHGSVTAGCDHFGHRELTVSSQWAHGELTVSSRWAVTVANFFLMGPCHHGWLQTFVHAITSEPHFIYLVFGRIDGPDL